MLKNKVAVITGASKGIGLGIAMAMGLAGASVILSSRDQEALDKIALDFRKKDIKAEAIAAHVGDKSQRENLIEFAIKKFGKLDILVNNAAANPVFGPVIQTEEAAFDKIMAINVKAPFELSKLAFSKMSESGGAIINISSIGGISPEPFLGIYSVSKAALISLTKVMAKEWGRVGVRVNCICPGLIKTKFSQALWSNEQIRDEFIKKLPIARIGNTNDIADAAVFLASEKATYCTGTVLTIDGGYTI